MKFEVKRKMPISHCAIFLIYFLSAPTKSVAIVEDVLDIIHVIKEVGMVVLKAWDVVQQTSMDEGVHFPFMREKQRRLLQRLQEVTRQIDETNDKNAHNIQLAIESVNIFTAKNAPLFSKMKDITDTMNSISSRYQQMQLYEQYRNNLEMHTLITFAEWTVSPNANSVHYLMDALHLALFGSEEKTNITTNMLTLLTQSYEVNDLTCNELLLPSKRLSYT